MRSPACLDKRAQKSGEEVLRDLGCEFSTHAPEDLPDDEGHRGRQEKVRAEGVGGGGRMTWGLILRGLVMSHSSTRDSNNAPASVVPGVTCRALAVVPVVGMEACPASSS